jgi:hypothetical protein
MYIDTRTWVKEKLEASGKSQSALAHHLGRGNDWVSLLLNCKRRLMYDDAVEIAQHRRKKIADLVLRHH